MGQPDWLNRIIVHVIPAGGFRLWTCETSAVTGANLWLISVKPPNIVTSMISRIIIYICIQRKEAENYTLPQACIGWPRGPYVDGLPKGDLSWSKSGIGLDTNIQSWQVGPVRYRKDTLLLHEQKWVYPDSWESRIWKPGEMEVHPCIQSIFSCNLPRFSISNYVCARIDRTLVLSSLPHDVPSIKPDFLTEHVNGASLGENTSL